MYMYSVDSLSHILKSWYTCEARNKDFGTILPMDLTRGLVSSVAGMDFESIAHKAEGRIGYWLRGHEGERNNCFRKIQLVGQKYRDKIT